MSDPAKITTTGALPADAVTAPLPEAVAPATGSARATTTPESQAAQTPPADGYADTTYDWTLVGADLTLTLARAGLFGAGQFPMPKVPLKIPFIEHGNLDPKTETPLRLAELGTAALSLGLDLWLDGKIIPDSSFTGATLMPPMSGGIGNFFVDEVGKVTDPWTDIVRTQRMVDYTGTNAFVNIGNILYMMAQGILSDDKIRAHAQKMASTYEYQDPDYLVDYVIEQTGGYPSGVAHDAYKEDVQQLINMYQESGHDAGSMYAYLAYLKQKYGIDFTNDRLGQLVTAGAQDSEQTNPDNTLTAFAQAVGRIAAAQEMNLSFVTAYGIHLMIDNMIDSNTINPAELGHLAGLAVPAANMAISAAQGIPLKDQGVSIATDLAATALGYLAAKAAGDDPELRLDIASALTQIGPAFYYPGAVADLSAVNEAGHAANSEGALIGNPTFTGAKWALVGIQGLGNLYSGYVAGKHLQRGIETGRPGEYLPLAIVGVAQIIEAVVYSQLMKAKKLPNNSYDFSGHLVPEVPMKGNDGLTTPLAISAGTTALGVGLGLVVEYIKDAINDGAEAEREPSLLDNITVGEGPAGTLGASVGIRF
ncbi:MAG: hypothetical protein HQM16_13330 [Deltaproteobacteria bacterium]|nr:hypothetical protein [Deltaproteobacteria bacterium]